MRYITINLYHLSKDDISSWFEISQTIAKFARHSNDIDCGNLNPILHIVKQFGRIWGSRLHKNWFQEHKTRPANHHSTLWHWFVGFTFWKKREKEPKIYYSLSTTNLDFINSNNTFILNHIFKEKCSMHVSAMEHFFWVDQTSIMDYDSLEMLLLSTQYKKPINTTSI